jgi:hypothetical protein
MRTWWLVRAVVAVAMTIVVGTATVVLAPPAAGGGPPGLAGVEGSFVRVGQRVSLRQEHVAKPDRAWKGPYRVSLVWSASDQPVNASRVAPRPEPAYVGDLRVERWSDDFVRVDVTFVVPRLPQGLYDVVTCGPGCRGSVGELGTSSLFVGAEEPRWAIPSMPPPMPVTPDDDAPVTAGSTAPAEPAVRPDGGVENVAAGFERPSSGPAVPAEPTVGEWLLLALLMAGLAVVVLASSVHRVRRRTRAGGSDA